MPQTREIAGKSRVMTRTPVLIEVQLGPHKEVVLVSKSDGIDPDKIRVAPGQQITWTTAVPSSQLCLIFRSDHKPVPGTIYLGGMNDPIALTIRGNRGDQFKYAVTVITEPLRTAKSLQVAVADPVIIIR